MKALKLMIIGLMCVVIASCATRNESKLDKLQPWGSDFSTSLSKEYRGFVVEKSKGDWGWFDTDQEYFATKGRYTTQGKVFEPERLEYWDISGQAANELREARTALMMAFSKDARALVPQPSAVAQANFDCWVEAAEDNNDSRMDSCRGAFYAAMGEIQTALKNRAVPKPDDFGMGDAKPFVDPDAQAAPTKVVMAAPATNREVPQYIIYFAFDKSSIDNEGMAQLGELLNDAALADAVTIRLMGHTDTAGTPQYNMDLSERRAKAVRSVLVNNGVIDNKIAVRAMGETDPVVQTGDGKPERLNRRVEILIVNPEPAR